VIRLLGSVSADLMVLEGDLTNQKQSSSHHSLTISDTKEKKYELQSKQRELIVNHTLTQRGHGLELVLSGSEETHGLK